MNADLANWKLSGQVFIWRYLKKPAWHLTAEPNACTALIELIETMQASATASHRTIKLTVPSEQILSVPNWGAPIREDLGKLRVVYDPSFDDLQLDLFDNRLELRLGDDRAKDLLLALSDVREGKGDFAFGPNKKRTTPPVWFWWMPWNEGWYQGGVRRGHP